MTIAAGLIASRFLHYAALMILFGAACFPLYIYRDATPPERFQVWQRRALLRAATASLLSAILWFAFTSATMAGSLAAIFDWTTLSLVVGTTDFGRIWVMRLALLGLGIVLLLPKDVSANQRLMVLGVAAIALTSISDTGHAGADNGPYSTFHITADAAHLSAAAAWIGGLVALPFALSFSSVKFAKDEILLRFSTMGYVAVALIVASGIANSWFLVGTVHGLFTTPYGQWLLAKLALFFGMVALAGVNRFLIVPRLARNNDADVWLSRLRRHVALEQGLGFLILAIVSVLGTIAPAAQG